MSWGGPIGLNIELLHILTILSLFVFLLFYFFVVFFVCYKCILVLLARHISGELRCLLTALISFDSAEQPSNFHNSKLTFIIHCVPLV